MPQCHPAIALLLLGIAVPAAAGDDPAALDLSLPRTSIFDAPYQPPGSRAPEPEAGSPDVFASGDACPEDPRGDGRPVHGTVTVGRGWSSGGGGFDHRAISLGGCREVRGQALHFSLHVDQMEADFGDRRPHRGIDYGRAALMAPMGPMRRMGR